MNTRDELKINIYLYSQINTTTIKMKPFVKQTIYNRSLIKTLSVALLTAALGFGTHATAAAKSDNKNTTKEIEKYFGERLAGKASAASDFEEIEGEEETEGAFGSEDDLPDYLK